jgi:hypothetical protein
MYIEEERISFIGVNGMLFSYLAFRETEQK